MNMIHKRQKCTRFQLRFYSIFWQDIMNRGKTQNLFSSLPCADYEQCVSLIAAIILPDIPISPLAASSCNSQSSCGSIESITDWRGKKKKNNHFPTSMHWELQGIARQYTFFWWQTKVLKCSQPWQFEQIKSCQWESQDFDRLWQHVLGFPFIWFFASFWDSLSVICLHSDLWNDCNKAYIE